MELQKKLKLQERYPILASSDNPAELSLTVKGILVGLIPLAIYLARQGGVELTETELVELVEVLTAAISAVVILIGVARKMINKFIKK